MTGKARASKQERENICFGCYAFSAYNTVKIQNLFFGYTPKTPAKAGQAECLGSHRAAAFRPNTFKKGQKPPTPLVFAPQKKDFTQGANPLFYLKFNKKLQHIFIFMKARKHYRQHRKKQNKRPLARQENIFLGKRGREKQNFKSRGALGYDTA